MNRRDVITLLAGAAAWPLPARAQQPAIPVIGFLHPGKRDALAQLLSAFQQGLRDLGFSEGWNLSIEYRWANDEHDRLPSLAVELVQRDVAAIAVPAGTSAVLAAKAATQRIPIIFNIGSDPVDLGLVASISRPGGNITGVSQLYHKITAKRFELLHDLVPEAAVICLLVNPSNSSYAASEANETQVAARALGLQLIIVNASKVSELDEVFKAVVRARAGALLVGADTSFVSWRHRFVDLATRHRLPVSYGYRDFAAVGGLMIYGTSRTEAYRQVGVYTGRILRGEGPADLPIHQPTKFELIINLKSAKAIGLDIPPTLLARADEVIE